MARTSKSEVSVPVTRHPASSVRSIRCPDEVWEMAKQRADAEGVAMSYVITQLVEGYALGAFRMPKMSKTFDVTRA